MLFSEYNHLQINGEESWFDPNIQWDTALFLDPILVFNNDLSEFKKTKERIKKFFDLTFKKVSLAKGKINPFLKKDALRLLSFKESYELGLGYTNLGQLGSGIGSNFARKIFDAMIDFIDWGLEDFGEYLSPFELFAEGIGADRISDMLSNIIKEDLILYTQKICNSYKVKIKMKKFLIQNVSFDEKIGWIHKYAFLPQNPITKKPIILVPKDFLRSSSDKLDFIQYVLRMENEELRTQASRLITENINKKQLRDIIASNKDIFKEFLKEYIRELKEKTTPYDLKNDPSLLWEYRDLLEKMKKTLPSLEVKEKTKNSLITFVEQVIEQFKKNVETKEGYRLLFNDDGKPRGEKASQTFFWCVAETICNISKDAPDISPEPKTGRGLVDFKFSRGYADKILVEIKLAKNKDVYHGLEKQLTTYVEAENVVCGFYLVIKQVKEDNVRVIKLEDRYSKMEENKKGKIKIKIVDAYIGTKTSASKI